MKKKSILIKTIDLMQSLISSLWHFHKTRTTVPKIYLELPRQSWGPRTKQEAEPSQTWHNTTELLYSKRGGPGTKQPYRTTDKERYPRHKSTCLRSINIPQGNQEYMGLAKNFTWIFLYNAIEKLEGTFCPTQDKQKKTTVSASSVGKIIELHPNHWN